ncbi:MAG: hypothetical protein RQ723_00440 [Desulfuromonadales bacterium]|nr:hypothetical protein [Desulfuromonadales bacterium]
MANPGEPRKKHPCPDCRQCQWCGDDRCRLCLKSGSGCRKKLSMAEQIELYEQLNAASCSPAERR